MSFDLDNDDDSEGIREVFELTVRNSAEVWAILNEDDIDHIVGEETTDELTLEFDSAEAYNTAVNHFTEKLGSQAYPEGTWPELIEIGSAP